MDKHYRALQTLKADVERATWDPKVEELDIRKGRIVMIPGKDRNFSLKLEWVQPDERLTIADGRFLMYVPKRNLAWVGSAASAKPKSGGATAFKAISMSRDELSANFTPALGKEAQLKDGTRTFHLILTPKGKQDFTLAELWVDKDGMPRQVKITYLNGTTDAYFLSKVEKNITVDRKIFNLNPPAGVKAQPV